MARLRTPPDFYKIMGELDPKEFIDIVGKLNATDNNGEYMPWHKFMWKTDTHNGLSKENAWLSTKIARNSLLNKFSDLPAEHEKFMQFCVPNSLYEKLHIIDKLTGGGHALSDSPLVSNGEKDRYLVRNLIMEEAITSSQLEGASTTRKVAKKMLSDKRNPKDKSEQMIVNNYMLMKSAVEKKDEELTIDLILEFHYCATHKAIDNGAKSGCLRDDNDITIGDIYNEVAHTPPCYKSLEDRLNKLCTFANTDHSATNELNNDGFIHPLIKAIILHFMIGYIHPFGDGNGRTARALFYWFMLKSGYWMFEYVSISKLIQEKRGDYDKAFIFTETDEFDMTYFIYHQADIVTKAVQSLQDHIDQKKSEFNDFRNWIDNSPISKNLKHGELEILKEAVKEGGKLFTSKSIAADFDINEGTARSYLNKLVDCELLLSTKPKNSRSIVYVAPAQLKDRLKL